MSFTLQLTPDFIQIDTGTVALLNLEIHNKLAEQDEYEIQIEGLDSEWIATPLKNLHIRPNDLESRKILVKVPRISESLTGAYPFFVRARSLKTREIKSTQSILEINPFQHISMEISPRRGVISPYHKAHEFTLTLLNLGNSEENMILSANDSDSELIFEFSQEKITLGAGQEKSVRFLVKAARKALLANSRLLAFSVLARAHETTNVIATTTAQIEQKPLASPSAFLMSSMAIGIIAGWVALIPKPPTLDTLTTDQHEVTLGELITLNWSSSHAKYVKILCNSKPLFKHEITKGYRTLQLKEAGKFILSAYAHSDHKKSKVKYLTVVVKKPIPIPPPEITHFAVSPKKLNLGQTFSVRYGVNQTTVKATLSPPGIKLDPKVSEIELVASRTGNIVYRLVAENSEGITATKSIRVSVSDASNASIVVFRSIPQYIPYKNYKISLIWQLNNAVRAEIKYDNHTVVIDPVSGEKELFLTESKDFLLIGYDSQGRVVEKKIRIDFKENIENEKITFSGTSEHSD